MKLLKNYEKDIQLCSKCGLCQAVCPIFLKTGNECDSIKGKLIMLDGILKGKLSPNETFFNYFKNCQNCDKCQHACPAGINIEAIIDSVINYKKGANL